MYVTPMEIIEKMIPTIPNTQYAKKGLTGF